MADFCRNGDILGAAMIRVLFCSDAPVLAAGLASVLGAAQGFELASVCETLAQARSLLGGPDHPLLLLDLTADSAGPLLAELEEAGPKYPVILWVREVPAELALQAVSLGVRGILRSTLGPELLLRCLEKVHHGELWFEKALLAERARPGPRLTRREAQLVGLLARGLKNRELAAALQITEGTVKVCLSRLFQKVGVKDRFELALYGLRHPRPGGRRFRFPPPAGAPAP